MKIDKLDETRLEEIIDYVEAYYKEGGDPDDVPDTVNESLNDFIDWAYDDLAINAEERERLKHSTPDIVAFPENRTVHFQTKLYI